MAEATSGHAWSVELDVIAHGVGDAAGRGIVAWQGVELTRARCAGAHPVALQEADIPVGDAVATAHFVGLVGTVARGYLANTRDVAARAPGAEKTAVLAIVIDPARLVLACVSCGGVGLGHYDVGLVAAR
jgi:hypothetical protein